MYYFKGRGFLWHDRKGPVLWWPPNWVWFGIFEFQRWREDRAGRTPPPGLPVSPAIPHSPESPPSPESPTPPSRPETAP